MRTLADRFWSKVDFSGDCWKWKGCKTKAGYGLFGVSRYVREYAHRIVWQLINGRIPDNLCVLHSCDNRVCVNPGHLFLGTVNDNAKDMVAKSRQSMGENRPTHKLTLNQVREILSSSSPQLETAKKFGVSQQLISGIRCGHRWRGALHAHP
jgi:hypothetical protein